MASPNSEVLFEAAAIAEAEPDRLTHSEANSLSRDTGHVFSKPKAIIGRRSPIGSRICCAAILEDIFACGRHTPRILRNVDTSASLAEGIGITADWIYRSGSGERS